MRIFEWNRRLYAADMEISQYIQKTKSSDVSMRQKQVALVQKPYF